jgi:hypothetical protein
MTQLAAELKLANTDAPSQRHYSGYHDSINRFVNWSIHSSGLGYWHIMAQGDAALGEDPTMGYVTIGPSSAAVKDALLVGWNAYTLVLRVFDGHFNDPLGSEINKRLFDCWISFYDDGTRASLGRNTPCPCRSGAKFKNCHGRLG